MITQEKQIEIQRSAGNLQLWGARIGKGGNDLKLSGFKDFTEFYKEKALEEFKKTIGEHPRSNVYVRVDYDAPNCRVYTYGFVTYEEFLKLPTKWVEFKKLLKK